MALDRAKASVWALSLANFCSRIWISRSRLRVSCSSSRRRLFDGLFTAPEATTGASRGGSGSGDTSGRLRWLRRGIVGKSKATLWISNNDDVYTEQAATITRTVEDEEEGKNLAGGGKFF